MKRSFKKDLHPKPPLGRLERIRKRKYQKGQCLLSNLFWGAWGLCHPFLVLLNVDDASLPSLGILSNVHTDPLWQNRFTG